MSFCIVIPARLGSERLPGKPLADIDGKALIRRVCERALESRAAEVIVATDDARIGDACRGLDVEVCMTGSSHRSGTDRIAEVVRRKKFANARVVVNLQGDEPLIPPAVIDQVAMLLARRPDAEIATLATPIHALSEFMDPNVVKVVSDRSGNALYFSRAPIPWHRTSTVAGGASAQRFSNALRHIGIYAYRAEPLLKLSRENYAAIEVAEHLEQLRALWLGLRIAVEVACEIPGPGVDVPEDLEKVTRLLRGWGQ